jgi:hypothetical protein
MVSLAKLQEQFLMMDFFDAFDLIVIFVLYAQRKISKKFFKNRFRLRASKVTIINNPKT